MYMTCLQYRACILWLAFWNLLRVEDWVTKTVMDRPRPSCDIRGQALMTKLWISNTEHHTNRFPEHRNIQADSGKVGLLRVPSFISAGMWDCHRVATSVPGFTNPWTSKDVSTLCLLKPLPVARLSPVTCDMTTGAKLCNLDRKHLTLWHPTLLIGNVQCDAQNAKRYLLVMVSYGRSTFNPSSRGLTEEVLRDERKCVVLC